MAVGNDGYSSSSAVSGINGIYLGFSVTWVGYNHPDNRGRGHQLRCLSE
ncbi:hypothetical protein [uncultured Rikenella sp.]|nr:hypothetical protein [uncultured Rikenella sp.]